ncbi:MAG: DUF2863 family protein [Burkholderiaceae bacterium]
MPKNKRPVPKKSNPSPEEKDDAVTQLLCDLAIDLVEQEDGESMRDELKQKEGEFNKLIRKALNQKKDDVLYESLERTKYADINAYQFLKDSIEEAAGTIVFRRDDGNAVEVNAFVIPLFVWSKGGLDSRACFQDQQAFDALTKSFQDAQLESAKATVVLVNHVYHLDEVDSITYSHLNEMVRNAYASMTDKKMVSTPAIERSFFGWPENHFGADDVAVELRFFLGFALKAVDDVFYQVPTEEAAADQYFEMRMERFQNWTLQVMPLMKRCLVTDDAEIDIKFLYQDLFHGAKERGMAEYFMLQMMAELNQGIAASGIDSKNTKAIVGIADVAGNPMLRVNLYAKADDALIASSDKPCAMIHDLQVEFDDAYDAMMTLGVTSVSIAMQFDEQGQPRDVRAYEA